MKCVTCGVDINDVPLYRSNPKGQPAIWECEECIGENDITEDVIELVKIIHKS